MSILGIFSNFYDKLLEIGILIAVVVLIATCIKYPGGRWFLGVILTIGFTALTVYCGIQLNYYYNETGGIYGQIVSLYNPNQVHITSNVEYLFENIAMTQDDEDTHSAKISSTSVLELVLDEDSSYGVYINGMPCHYVEIASDYVIAKYEYNFLDENLNLLLNDTLNLKFAFYTNSTYLVVSTDGGAEAVKYWNYYFNKNIFKVTIDNQGYEYNQDVNFGTGDISSYSVATYYLNNEVYLKQVYKNGDVINLPDVANTEWLVDGSVIASPYVINQNLDIHGQSINYTITYNGNGGIIASSGLEELNDFRAMTHNSVYNLLANPFVKDGYEFVGWSTSPNGEVEFVNSGSTVNLSSICGSHVTLYAQWANEYYTAEIYCMDIYGNFPLDSNQFSRIIPAIAGETITLVDEIDKLLFAVEDGIEFAYAKDGFGNVVTTYTIAEDNSTVIHFYFTRVQHTLTLNAKGGIFTDASDWMVVSDIANISLYYGTPFTLLSIPTPIKAGYTFMGWFTKEIGGTQLSISYDMDVSNITFYAQWQENE